jgi:hypothetical protein
MVNESKDLDRLPVPAILVIDDRHCVVFDGWDAATGQARIFEPATGRSGLERPELVARLWTGEALLFGRPPPTPTALVAAGTLAALCVFAPGWWVVGRRRATRPGEHDSHMPTPRRAGVTACHPRDGEVLAAAGTPQTEFATDAASSTASAEARS